MSSKPVGSGETHGYEEFVRLEEDSKGTFIHLESMGSALTKALKSFLSVIIKIIQLPFQGRIASAKAKQELRESIATTLTAYVPEDLKADFIKSVKNTLPTKKQDLENLQLRLKDPEIAKVITAFFQPFPEPRFNGISQRNMRYVLSLSDKEIKNLKEIEKQFPGPLNYEKKGMLYQFIIHYPQHFEKLDEVDQEKIAKYINTLNEMRTNIAKQVKDVTHYLITQNIDEHLGALFDHLMTYSPNDVSVFETLIKLEIPESLSRNVDLNGIHNILNNLK